MPDRSPLGPMPMLAGLALLLLGVLAWFGALSWFGRLPGDIRVERLVKCEHDEHERDRGGDQTQRAPGTGHRALEDD